MVDRVLGGDEKERRLERIRLAVHRDPAFGHRFQEGGLGSRRGAVDFVGEDRLRENRPRPKFELRGLLVEDRDAGHIGGKEVGRTLEPLEHRADAASQGPGQHRLGDAGHVFQEDVPFAEVGDQGQHQLLPLADDHLLDVGDDFLGKCRRRRRPGGACSDAASVLDMSDSARKARERRNDRMRSAAPFNRASAHQRVSTSMWAFRPSLISARFLTLSR